MNKLNKLLHQELRLAIVSYLAGVEWVNFNKLLDITEATKGNLSVQIKKLEAAGYLEIKKSFKDNYPLTQCKITDDGRNALDEYVKDLKQLLNMK
ncbi:MAG: transcriptional regulator [Crocinitomicaceae bacterium]|nr:transcriptional regulator [Crocinitomicaceae bacterium]